MNNNEKSVGAKEAKGRILFTGRGEMMLEDLMEHMPGGYESLKCQPVNTDFIAALDNFRPHVIVVYLLNETRDMLRMYDVLADHSDYLNIPVIAMGNEEDCQLFKQKVMVDKLEIFKRPFSRSNFFEALERNAVMAMELIEGNRKREEEEARKKEAEKNAPKAASTEELIQKIDDWSILGERKSVLVVDDDVRMLNIIKLYMQDLYDVTVVPSGFLALKFLSKKKCDLVLLDYMMPDMDGPSILKEIRTNSPCPNIPVLFLSGVCDKELVMKSFEFHPNGYLLKPTTRDILLERVTELLLDL